MRRYLILPLVGLLATACASAQAKGSNEKPALNVPPPPQHEIELPAEPLEPVGEVPTVPDLPPPARPGRAPATRSQPADAKPEKEPPKPDAPAAASPEPAPGLPPAAGSPQLRTPQTADTSTAAKSVRTTIDRARSTLHTVNLGVQNNERKKAYHNAELFLQQAEDALKDGKLEFAQAVATKAETLAKELAGR